MELRKSYSRTSADVSLSLSLPPSLMLRTPASCFRNTSRISITINRVVASRIAISFASTSSPPASSRKLYSSKPSTMTARGNQFTSFAEDNFSRSGESCNSLPLQILFSLNSPSPPFRFLRFIRQSPSDLSSTGIRYNSFPPLPLFNRRRIGSRFRNLH